MAKAFCLQDMYGAPVSSVSMNYEFNFLGKNTRLIGAATVSYSPIDDNLVEREVEEFEKEEGSWGFNLFLGGLVTAACATVAVVAVVVAAPVAVAVVAGCAAVGAAAVTANITMTDYRKGKARPWYETLEESVLGAVVGAAIGGILVTSYPIITEGIEALPELLNSMFLGGGSQELALAGGGTSQIARGIEIAGGIESILGIGVSVDLIKKSKKIREDANLRGNNGGRNFKINKQKKGTPKNNQAQNKSFRDIVKKLNLNKDEQRQLHDAISHQNFSYQEILDEAIYMFKK